MTTIYDPTRGNQPLATALLNGLDEIPAHWALMPVNGNKAGYRKNWTNESPLSKDAIAVEINSKIAKGYGLRTGVISGGLVAIDLDGVSAHAYMLSKLSDGQELPKTVGMTSGRPGRRQLLYKVPQHYWDSIQTYKEKTGVKDEEGKPEQIELRWDGLQSVLPPSVHPITGQYRWLDGCSPQECEIAEAPLWVIEKMLKPSRLSSNAPTGYQPLYEEYKKWTDIDWALSYLGSLSPSRSDDYGEWVAVGMALHSVSDSLLSEWDKWSQQSDKYKSGDCERKWKSFKRSGIAIGSLAHMAKQDGWKSPLEGKHSSHNGISHSNGNGKHHTEAKDAKALLELPEKVKAIINQDLSDSERKTALIQLSKDCQRPLSEIEELVKILEKEEERIELREETAADIDKLLAANKASVDVRSLLPASLANPLCRIAEWLNLRPEVYLTTVLTAVSSLHKVGTRVMLVDHLDFDVTPNLYAGIVAESSQKKSPILQAMVYKPLRLLQAEAREEFAAVMQEYQININEYYKLKGQEQIDAFPEGKPKEPRQKLYYLSSTSGEGLYYQMQAHPEQGLLYIQDELAGILKSANQYRNGKGSDEEDLLSFYDGMGCTILRASGVKADLDGTNLALLGSIQPGVLQEHMQDCSDSNGKWARFIFVNQPVALSVIQEDGVKFDMTRLLADLYKKVDALEPTTYRLDREALSYFVKAYNRLDYLRCTDPSQGMRSVWGKSEGRIGKLALNLHVIHELLNGREPSEVIPKARIVEAVKLVEFYASQVRALHIQFSDTESLSPQLSRIVDLSADRWIKVREVQRLSPGKYAPNADTVKAWFKELESMGKGQTRKVGKSFEFKSGIVDTLSISVSTNETLTQHGIQPIVDVVDVVDVFEQLEKEDMSSPPGSSTACFEEKARFEKKHRQHRQYSPNVDTEGVRGIDNSIDNSIDNIDNSIDNSQNTLWKELLEVEKKAQQEKNSHETTTGRSSDQESPQVERQASDNQGSTG